MRKKTNEEFTNEVKNLVGNEFEFLEEYKGAFIKIKVKHNVCGRIFEIKPASFLHCGNRCYPCSMEKRKIGLVEYKKRVREKWNNEYEILGDYINSHLKIKTKHTLCNNVFEIRPYDLLNGHGCSICAKNINKTHDQFIQDLKKFNMKIELLTKYKNNKSNVTYKCLNCGTVKTVTASCLMLGSWCCSCVNSKGEEEVAKILNELNIIFHRQYRFKECKNIKPLPFDFCISYNNEILCLIEYDGIQHFQFKQNSKISSKENLIRTQKNDNIKNEFCKRNIIPLIRIPYYEKNIKSYLIKELYEKIPSQAYKETLRRFND